MANCGQKLSHLFPKENKDQTTHLSKEHAYLSRSSTFSQDHASGDENRPACVLFKIEFEIYIVVDFTKRKYGSDDNNNNKS
jgi:hypothetical protein